jgi:hypothetical protein
LKIIPTDISAIYESIHNVNFQGNNVSRYKNHDLCSNHHSGCSFTSDQCRYFNAPRQQQSAAAAIKAAHADCFELIKKIYIYIFNIADHTPLIIYSLVCSLVIHRGKLHRARAENRFVASETKSNGRMSCHALKSICKSLLYVSDCKIGTC